MRMYFIFKVFLMINIIGICKLLIVILDINGGYVGEVI